MPLDLFLAAMFVVAASFCCRGGSLARSQHSWRRPGGGYSRWVDGRAKTKTGAE
jgi:hypothetical protein